MTSPATSLVDSAQIRALVVEAVEASAELMASSPVADQWNEASALEGMTVGALAAHLVRAAGSTIAYLDRTPVDALPSTELLTPTTYFHAAIGSPIHERIKHVSAQESSLGHSALTEKCTQLAADLKTRLATEPDDRLVAALGDRFLTLDDFCRTRMIEVLVHLDDLAVSTSQRRPVTDPTGIAIVIDISVGIARHAHGDWNVLYALARTERSAIEPVFPAF
ncbi:MAG: hypothetical protein HOH36_08690 [Acidimicrobiaceae bacterium]|jgi:hypothetical protein|nr:hypothetical protein [Acidimicrobiaceae bacterium]MBT5581852.1 hypothetical protein [Acidimicrobiaceae bacterium]MBT5850496.1 hypothetical protein [Acidimicrobiaceae bacterium]